MEIDATIWADVRQAPLVRDLDIVLKPLSRPELGEIRIDEAVFAIGRTERPFASYGNEILNMLSRRHARIFREDGFVYLADLESRNGTTVNRVGVGRAPCQLRDGDEICFGGALSYCVQITPRTRAALSLTLTLTPQSGDSGLDTIMITKFPFLVSKTDATFSNYKSKSEHCKELTYLSRRHAYIYPKGGQAYIEDLGSSNGTFIDDARLSEHAVPLQDGALVAFGGKHFVYRVSITGESGVEPANSGARKPPAKREPNVPKAVDSGKTQFMAAPTSFLDIFCAADESKDDVAPDGSPAPEPAAKEPLSRGVPAVRRRPRGRVMLLLSELASLVPASGEADSARRSWWMVAAAAGFLGALALTAYFWGASERNFKDAVARGDYARAAAISTGLLENHPDDVELKALATEAGLKANVPMWLVKVRARDFDGAKGVLTGMTELSRLDTDLRPLIDELDWLGNLERLVSDRGGPEAPIRIYADEDTIEHLIGRWNDDTGEHQRALARIASRVPQFGDWYGEALTHLRRLQSDSTVYLPVIERIKANIATELERDNSDALNPTLEEMAEKYPALGGLDNVRQDLARYIEIRREARTRKSGRLFALLRKAHFVTPPFEQSFRALTESGQLPPADLLQLYDTAARAWEEGNLSEALTGLQKMTSGPWGEGVAEELERRRGVIARFNSLQQSRNAGPQVASAFVDQLLAFRQSLDVDEDVYFVRATAADLHLQRDKVLARAQDDMNKARTLWQEYRSNGPIDASQRIETSVSDQFRTRAHLLADASRYAQQSLLIYSQVDVAAAAQWSGVRDEIEAEAREQRSRLHDLSNVVEPGLLKIKLALLGDPNE